jgi:threonine dehydrogenase-like Zn-dependent dehydrogenase
MDPFMMFGAWAAALVSVAAAGKLIFNAFLKATKLAVSEEFAKVWKELNESDKWHQERFSAFERALDELRQQVFRLERLMQEHMSREQ